MMLYKLSEARHNAGQLLEKGETFVMADKVDVELRDAELI